MRLDYGHLAPSVVATLRDHAAKLGGSVEEICVSGGEPAGHVVLLGREAFDAPVCRCAERAAEKGSVMLSFGRPLHAFGGARMAPDACVEDAHALLPMLQLSSSLARERMATRNRAETEQTFFALVEAFPDGLLVIQGGPIAYANPTLCRWLGYSREELIGRSVFALLHPDDRAGVEKRARKSLASHAPAPPRLARMVTKDGSIRVVESTAMPVEFRGSRAIVALFRDATERQELESKLRVADRLVSMGTLVAGLAHEINNPLAVISMSIELLERGLKTGTMPSEALERVRDVGEATARAAALVRDLKVFSRNQGDHRGAIDVLAVLESTLRIADHEVRHHARLVRSLGDVPAVLGDEGRLGQVFLNLVLNAQQAFDENMPVGDREIRIRTRTDDAHRAVVEVEDNGAGIPASVLPRLFDPFFTTKPVGVGTGLGLAICQRIVMDMGGTIDVESVEGRGSVFRVSLPSVRQSIALPKATPLGEKTRLRSLRILVVDDEEAIGRALRSLLYEHEVTVVTSGADALEHLAETAAPDLVLCDLMMPDMNGMQLFQRVSLEHPELAARFVFVTGGAANPRFTDFLHRVPNRTLEKPFPPAMLDALLEHVASPS